MPFNRCVLIVAFVFIPFILAAQDYGLRLDQIQHQTLESIARYEQVILEASQYYGIDPLLSWGVLYVEKTQYELDEWLKLRRGVKSALTNDHIFFTNLTRWANLSVGFTHIKPGFALETLERAKALALSVPMVESDFDPLVYGNSPELAIWIMVLSFRVFIEQWKPFIDLTNRPEILATLFNLGYERSFPHGNPGAGGSVYPIILNGELLEGLSFGDRVGMVVARF